MSSTLLSDVIIPDLYLGYTSVNDPERSVLVQSGIVLQNPLATQLAAAAGFTGTIPFWKDLDATQEPNYSTDSPSDIAVPDKITADEMSTRKMFINKGYSAGDLVGELAGSDPMQRIRDRIGTWWTRQFQHRIIATLTGLYNSNLANNSGDMIVSVAVESIANQTAQTKFTRDAFTTAVFTMGDMFEQIKAIAVHSAVYQTMVRNDDIAFVQPSEGSLNLPTFMGKYVIIDDTLPKTPGTTSGFKYTCYLFGDGAISFGSSLPKVPVAIQRYENQGNGGGVETLWQRKTWLIHPFGYDWNNVTVTGQSPTNANVALAANWTRVIPRKLVPLAFLIVNA